MRPMLLLLLLSACAVPSSEEAPAPAPAPDAAQTDRPDLARLGELVHRGANAARRAEGVPPLAWSDALAAVAEGHSRDMAARDFFDHDTPEGLTPQDRARSGGVVCEVALGGGRTRVGVSENLFQITRFARIQTRGTGPRAERTVDWFSADEVARRAVDGWLESPGHRRNLLDRVSTRHGIGVATDRDDRVYITQVLC